MSNAATRPGYDYGQYFKSRSTYSSARPTDRVHVMVCEIPSVAANSVASIINRINDIVNDKDQYEDGEQPPSDAAVNQLKELLASATIPISAPIPEISVYYGELDITWQANGKLVRLLLIPKAAACRIYFHRDADAALTRGHSQDASNEFLSHGIHWLAG